MRWKRFAAAGFVLTPALTGCSTYYYAARTLVNEPITIADQLGRRSQLHHMAKDAWLEVRGQYARCLFTDEFRHGFMDGFVDYLDRGGNGQPPAVPPKKYTRNRYMNPEGHARVQDYFLGFQYGTDVAIATGMRHYLTTPILLPDRDPNPPRFNITNGQPAAAAPAADPTPGSPLPPPRTSEPKVDIPATPPVKPGEPMKTGVSRPPAPGSTTVTLPAGGPSKFGGAEQPDPTRPAATDRVDVPAGDLLPATPVPVPADPAAVPPLPPAAGGDGSKFIPFVPPGSAPAGGGVAPIGYAYPPLPAPPPGVAVVPDGEPTPPVTDDIPVRPANHYVPTPRPPAR